MYRQMKVRPEAAADLLPEGRIRVAENLRDYTNGLEKGDHVRIVTSPYGRAIETAKIAKESLERDGHKCSQICVEEEIEELRNFDDGILRVLCNGGIVQYGDQSVQIDARLTNPAGTPYPLYYMRSEHLGIPPEGKSLLPAEVRRILEGIETFPDATLRMLNYLDSLSVSSEMYDHALLITHDGCLAFAVTEYTQGSATGVEPGGFVTLLPCDDDFWVVGVHGFDDQQHIALKSTFERKCRRDMTSYSHHDSND